MSSEDIHAFGRFFLPNLIGCSTPDILALFTSRQKQNGFLFRSGYKQANFCIKWSCCFAKNEESHVFQSWVIFCVEVLFKAISNGLNKITKSFKYSLYSLVYNYYWSCNIKSFKFSFCLLWYILKQLFTSVSVNSARVNQHFNPWFSPMHLRAILAETTSSPHKVLCQTQSTTFGDWFIGRNHLRLFCWITWRMERYWIYIKYLTVIYKSDDLRVTCDVSNHRSCVFDREIWPLGYIHFTRQRATLCFKT